MNPKATAILALLRTDGQFVSGEDISSKLGVSRAAVWKHIDGLRQMGYGVEAVPSRGYRLITVPDVLDVQTISDHLSGALIGVNLVYFKETASTNSDAFRMAEEGAVEGSVVLADAQTAGKGRRGRTWASPSGTNLYCSVVLRPHIMPHEAPQLTFLSAVAVARTIERTTGLAPEIKWPNDVLIQGKKVAGLLNEMSAETDGINFVILGIGINLNMAPAQFPPDLRYPATSLLIECGHRVDRSTAAACLMAELDLMYGDFLQRGFAPVRDEWQSRCNASGRQVMVTDCGQEPVVGMFAGIDEDGALLLDVAGVRQRILSGDVRVV